MDRTTTGSLSLPSPRPTSEPVGMEGVVPDAGVSLCIAIDEHGRRHAFFVPVSSGRGRRRVLSTEQGIAVSGLQHLNHQAQEIERQTRRAVHHCREQGVSWAVIGLSTGLAENGARGRFGEPGQVVEGEAW